MELEEITPQTSNGHEFVGLDGFRLELDAANHEVHAQISQYLEEMIGYNSWNVNPKMAATGEKLLDRDYPDQITLVLALVKRLGLENSKRHYQHRAFFAALLRPLLMRRLPYTEADLLELITFIAARKSIDVPLVTLLGNVQRFIEVQPLSSEMRNALQTLKQSQSEFSDKKPTNKIDELLGNVSRIQPESGEAWADKALSDLSAIPSESRSVWEAVFAHTATAESAKPSAKWLAEAARHRQQIGETNFDKRLGEWLNLVALPPPFDRVAPKDEGAHLLTTVQAVKDASEFQTAYLEFNQALKVFQQQQGYIAHKNQILLKGLAWYATLSTFPEIVRGLAHMTQTAFTTIVTQAAFSQYTDRGTYSAKLGNAGIWALGQMPGGIGVGALAALRTRLRDRGALKLIAAAIESAAKASGMTVEELEDLAVPTGGLDTDGTRTETFGAEGSARLTLDGTTGRTKLEWFGADGKPRKAVPAGVKREFGAEVKALKAAEEEVASALSAQAARLDRALLDERVLTLGVWRERYAGHPVLGNLARRLVWTVGGVAALPVGDGFEDVAGQAITGLADEAEVKLWHPIHAAPEEVMRWRDALETRGLVQPFKQAHRELYLLTDAERATSTYSNRFAAHILKQHQFNSLCILRGWKNTLRLMVDDSYPPATRLLPQFSLRAEFWVEGIGDDYQVDTNEAGTYLRLATDQVRFYREFAETNYAHAHGGGYAAGLGYAYRGGEAVVPTAPVPLAEVPPLALSEVMRDVDLFVGVASLGNDPAWSDGGPEGRFRGYWSDYAFGDLGETARTRAEVLAKLLPRLKIASRCVLDGKFLIVRGDLRTYKIHLGSGNILMEPNDQYLCIVTGRSEDTGDLFLPFEGDRMLAIILSKAFLLADDTRIKDPTIVSQIRR